RRRRGSILPSAPAAPVPSIAPPSPRSPDWDRSGSLAARAHAGTQRHSRVSADRSGLDPRCPMRRPRARAEDRLRSAPARARRTRAARAVPTRWCLSPSVSNGMIAPAQSRFGGNAGKGREDAHAGPNRSDETSRNLGIAAAPPMVIGGNLQYAQSRSRRSHLHLEIPSVGQLADSKLHERVAPDRTQGAHVRITHAVKKSHAPTGDPPGRELVPGDASGLAIAAGARRDDEIVTAGPDGLDQPADAVGIVGAVAVPEYGDVGAPGPFPR